jgi:hypothetical protein
LPRGRYVVTGGVIRKKEIFNEKFLIPRAQKQNEVKETRVYVTKNINKASIDIDRRIIFIDKEIFYSNEVIRKAVLYHELAHYYYYDEKLCDMFSIQKMREEGYAKSLIAAAFNSVLYSDFRKKHVLQRVNEL